MTNSTITRPTRQENRNKAVDRVELPSCWKCGKAGNLWHPMTCSPVCAAKRQIPVEVTDTALLMELSEFDELEPGEYSLGAQTDDSLIIPEREDDTDYDDDLPF